MKKIIVFILIFLVLVISSGCTDKDALTPNNVHREPHFTGVVVEVIDNSILVNVNENEEVRKNGVITDLVYVSLDTELGSEAQYNISDEVVVYYDGLISDSYPQILAKVYMISFECACQKCKQLYS